MAFYQIGIEPRYALPFPFGAGLGILLFAGIALGFGWLIETELRRDPRSFRWCVPLALLVVAATATSTLSRFFFMLHAGAYGIAAALWVRRRRAPWLLWAPSLFLAGLLTLGSVYGVSWLRGKAYPIAGTGQILPELTPGFRWRELLEEDPQPLRAQAAVQLRPSRPDARPARPARPPIERSPEEVERAGAVRYLREIPALFVRRWIGLEGLMAVSSHPHLGPALLREALFERPPPDGLGVYQEIARASSYRRVGRFAPMTLPGFLGVAYYSGSMLVVLLSCWAMAFALTAADLGLERMGVRPWARAAGGATVGYLVVQANMMTSTVRAIAGVLAVLFLIGLLERWLEIEPREPHRSGPG
jgi:hypothetical protein